MVTAASIGSFAYSEDDYSPEPARQIELMQLLRQDCGACHGMRLRGGLGPALTSKALNTKSKEFITTTILEGRTGTPMPPWKLFLSRDEASWMAAKLKKGIEE